MDKNIYVDPEKLRDFSKQLKKFTKNTESALLNLNGQLARLNNSWQDQDFDKFATNVQKTQRRLKAFASETSKITSALDQDAEAISEYQKHSLPD